ncbi:hypothetical protein GGF46_000407 [Coemansia sp. RSA 552]|nr:hypothetical protein GGF46_000407 [Coemansia sp. RSA 552]
MRRVLHIPALSRALQAQPALSVRSIHNTAACGSFLSRVQSALVQARPGSKRRSGGKEPGVADRRRSTTGDGGKDVRRDRAAQDRRVQPVAGLRGLDGGVLSAQESLGLPRVFPKIEQPADAEVARFVLIGTANAGKSTLVNQLVEEDVSIVSPNPHTTRTRVSGGLTRGNKQLVLIDTPGVVSRAAINRVARGVVKSPWLALAGADCIVFLLDGSRLCRKSTVTEEYLFDHICKVTKVPALLVVNKIDVVDEMDRVLGRIRGFMEQYGNVIGEPIFISALGNVGVDTLRAAMMERTKPGMWEFPANVKTDMSDLRRVEELIRSEWYSRLEGYMPYVVRQRNAGWKEGEPEAGDALSRLTQAELGGAGPRRSLQISQELIVSSANEAKILLGAKGERIREMASSASRRISRALDRSVRVHLQVVIDKSKRPAPE